MNIFSYFANKRCDYCNRVATTFRLIKHRHEYLCDMGECDKKSRIRAGYFTELVGFIPSGEVLYDNSREVIV